jgi:hypothetical protein
MSDCVCRELEESCGFKKFQKPTDDELPLDAFICFCGQKWYCKNCHFGLWRKVESEGEWQEILAESFVTSY